MENVGFNIAGLNVKVTVVEVVLLTQLLSTDKPVPFEGLYVTPASSYLGAEF